MLDVYDVPDVDTTFVYVLEELTAPDSVNVPGDCVTYVYGHTLTPLMCARGPPNSYVTVAGSTVAAA